jgi:hypothetical protein
MPSVVAFPAITPNASEMGIITNSKQFISPLTGYTQTASRKGGRWFLRMTFSNLQGSQRSVLRGYLAFMEGQVNRISVGDHSYTGARGALGGTPLVNGGSQVGTSLITNGWPASTLVLRAGDLFSFSNGTYSELKQVTSDGTSDASGNLTISIAPEIHTSPATTAAIVTASPVGTFMLASPTISWTNRPSQSGGVSSPLSDLSIDLLEDIGT